MSNPISDTRTQLMRIVIQDALVPKRGNTARRGDIDMELRGGSSAP